MLALGGDGGRGQVPSGAKNEIPTDTSAETETQNQLKHFDMITQNPIIGRAKNKLGGIYARTMYGKNILQSCPPPNKNRETPNEARTRAAFGRLSELSNQVSASLLNNIFYIAPIGRSRRAEWCKQLAQGIDKTTQDKEFNPSLISQLGSNTAVSDEPLITTPQSTAMDIHISELSQLSTADTTKTPLLILICQEANICISLLPYTTIDETDIHLQNLSTTLLGKTCYIFPLWQTNIGTRNSEIFAYGSFLKASTA